MKLKIGNNIRKNGISSTKACIMLTSNLAGIDKEYADLLVEDMNMDKINDNTFSINRRKIENYLSALHERAITVYEFQEMLRGEIDRTSVSYNTIKV